MASEEKDELTTLKYGLIEGHLGIEHPDIFIKHKN